MLRPTLLMWNPASEKRRHKLCKRWRTRGGPWSSGWESYTMVSTAPHRVHMWRWPKLVGSRRRQPSQHGMGRRYAARQDGDYLLLLLCLFALPASNIRPKRLKSTEHLHSKQQIAHANRHGNCMTCSTKSALSVGGIYSLLNELSSTRTMPLPGGT